MAGITTYLSILTLNVNELNSPIKRHHLANWIKKEDLIICCLKETKTNAVILLDTGHMLRRECAQEE
jgi:exonuclease III